LVRVAFIVEGGVEKIVIDSLVKNGWFRQKDIEQAGPTIDAKGGGNLCPRNISQHIQAAKAHKPDKIVILTDLECDPCITETKKRLGDCSTCEIIVAKKAIESWFLADSTLMRTLTRNNTFFCEYPEKTADMPYDEIKKILITATRRGTGSKVTFAKKAIKNNFNIENAANHTNCSSAKYFLDKIDGLTT
jgi:hypothetical protein